MNKPMKIGTYLGIWLSLCFLLLAAVVIFLVNKNMREEALSEAETKARLLMDRNLATHRYFTHHLRPTVSNEIKDSRPSDYFEPVWMSSTYAIRIIDKYFKDLNRQDYYYREAAINARSPENEADEYERTFLEKLKKDPGLKQTSEIRYIDSKPYFTVMKKSEIMQSACLRCHTSPELAPKDLVKIYGADRSFHRDLNEVASVSSIRIPLSAAYAQANLFAQKLSVVLVGALLCLALFFFWLNKKLLLTPLASIREKAALIAGSPEHLGEQMSRPKCKELADLVNAFNEMSNQLKEVRDQLEQRVLERTEELLRAKEALEKEIVERKLIEKALRESEIKYRNFFVTSRDFVFISGIDGKFVDFNDAAMEILGYSPEDRQELMSIQASQIYANSAERDAHAERVTKLGFSKEYPVDLIKKDGTIIHTLATAVARKDDQGTVVGFQGTVRDITEQKRAEEALRESEQKFLTAFNNSPVAMAISSTIDGKYVDVNEVFLKDTGFARDEVIGHTSVELEIFVDINDRERLLAAVRDHGSAYGLEMKFLTKSRQILTCLISTNLIHMGGHPHLLSTIVDITQRKQAEEERETLKNQLLQSQKMEALGTLTGGIAHNFNNLFTVILGYSELLLAEADDNSQAYKDIHKIFHSAQSGADLVRRLTAFSAQGDMTPIPLDLNVLLRDSEGLLSRTLPKMISIQMNLANDLGVVTADPAQMDQIVMNLAINAMDAMPDGGILTLETKRVTLDGELCSSHPGVEPGEYAMLAISDTGRGMDKDLQGKVFDPFFTSKGWDSEKGKGLGLAVVRGIVRRHGGVITCAGEVGKGSTFSIYLPLLKAAPATDESGSESPHQQRSARILVVDDEEYVRSLAERILTGSGYTVFTAKNGIEALDLYCRDSSRIDLVILDLIMPEMDGKQFLKRVLTFDPDAKVIIATGYSPDESAKEAVEFGAKGCVSKPFTMKQLNEVIHRVMDFHPRTHPENVSRRPD